METDEDIIKLIVSELKDKHQVLNIFDALPKIVLILEKNYKRLLGKDKKKLTLLCIKCVCLLTLSAWT